LFNIYKSNKIEVISDLIAKDLKINPPFITEKIDIAIPNYFFGKWLREKITISNQISALYELKTISNYTETLLMNIYPESDIGLWNFESIKWGILDSLEELNTFKESFPIDNWIVKYLDNNKIIDGDIYNLAKNISKNFVDYLIYRPEMISNWNRYELNSPNLFNNLNSNEYWQPILYKLLEKKISDKPSCLYIMDVINNFQKFKNHKNQIPNQIYIISDNNLSKLSLNFYLKISKLTKVNLYLLLPGNNLWNRINTFEGRVDFNDTRSKSSFNDCNLERIFGKFGGNYQKLIEETTNVEDIILNDHSIYIDPTIDISKTNNITLLNQLQKRLIDNNNNDLIIKENDDSIIFRGHINQLSQFEYVRTKVIEILKSNEDIKYSDIAIVSPQTSLIKPFLKYIFNNEIINGQKIPFFFIDDDSKNSSDIYDFLLDITEIANEKITLEKLDYFLSRKSTQNLYCFDVVEKNEVILILNQLGFHWGLDSNERLGEYKNTLEWCINRITLGLIYDEENNLNDLNLKPFSPKNVSLDLHKWVKILNQLKKNINLLRDSLNYLGWVKNTKFILNNIGNQNGNLNLEISEINKILDNYSISLIPNESIMLNVFREILITCINKAKYRNQPRINKILVSDIEKGRIIPHKIIFLIDMNSNYYPKLSNNENINLLNKKYLLGDPSVFDREKYFFLELLISCRDKLIISWFKNDKNNQKLDISFPIKEFISFFNSFLTKDQKDLIIKDFDYKKEEINNFENSNNIKENYSLVNNIVWEEKKFNFKNYKLSELVYWFKTPQHYWLNKKNISPKGIFIHHSNEESVSNFQKSKLVSKVIQKLEIDNLDIVDDLRNLNIINQFLEDGIIAPKNSIFTKEKEIKDLLFSLATNLSEHNEINRIYLKSNSNKQEYFISDNVVIELIHSKLSLKHLSEAWIKLLFLSSLDKKITETKLIFRKENQYKSEIIKSPGSDYSMKILNDYINIFKNCSEKCFPFPPESTYKYVEAKIKFKNEQKAFSERWIGNKYFNKGERDNIEMKMCFGNEKDPDFFLSNNEFDNLSCKIYRPLLEALQNN